ncbi:hypothetical protein Tco_0711086 [Tanacetum coccineum]
MKREGKDFSGRVTPLFAIMMVQATQVEGVDSGISTDSQHTPITAHPSSSRPQKKQSRRKQRKETEVLDLEKAKDTQAKEIAGLKKRDKESLGAQEDASKQGRIKIINETQGRFDDGEMFDIDDLHDDEVIVDMVVGEKQEKSAKINEREVSTGVEDSVALTITITTADEGVTAATIDEITPTSAPTIVIDELTLAQTLIEIKEAKPKAVTTATTTTTTRTKARGVTKDKGKAIMIEPEIPLKRKDQVALDEEMARNLEAQLQAELMKEDKMARKKKEEANIALIESWENKQAMMEADRLLAERLQTREQEELTDEEKKDEISSKKTEIAQDSSAKRARDKLESDESKKQKTDENEEVKEDNEIIKEGIIGHYQLIRVDGSSKRYSSMIRMLQGIDREDLETLWKLFKTKHGNTRPEDEHERVLWGDLKVMFEPDIKSKV